MPLPGHCIWWISELRTIKALKCTECHKTMTHDIALYSSLQLVVFVRAIISEQGQQHGITMSAKLQIRAKHVTKQHTSALCYSVHLSGLRHYDRRRLYYFRKKRKLWTAPMHLLIWQCFMMFLTCRLVSVQEHEANTAVVGLFFQLVYSTPWGQNSQDGEDTNTKILCGPIYGTILNRRFYRSGLKATFTFHTEH